MKIGVYVELDTLIDTRLGVVAQMGNDLALKLLKSNYRGRLSDELSLFVPEIDDSEFNVRYLNRNKLAVALGIPTKFTKDLSRICEELTYDPTHIDRTGTDTSSIELIVNIFPYVFTDEEKIELEVVLRTVLGTILPIKIISYDIAGISIEQLIKRNWLLVFTYSTDKFLSNLIMNGLLETKDRFPDCTVHCPQLAISNTDLKAVVNEKLPNGQYFDPFPHLQLALCRHVTVEYVNSDYYSAIDFRELSEEASYDDTVEKPEPPPEHNSI